MPQTVTLSKKQGQAYAALHPDNKVINFVGFGGGAYGGKSWLGNFWLLSMCLAYPNTRWFIGREELKRLRRSTYQTFHKVVREYHIPANYLHYNAQDHYLEFINGSRIDMIELKFLPSDPLFERFGSEEYTGGWIEEAGEVHFGAFDTLKSRIGRQLNEEYGIPAKLLCTFNPKKNWLYQLFYQPWKNGALPENYQFIQSLINDNPFREAAAEQSLNELSNKAQRQRLLFGNWEYDDEPDQLIPFQWLEQATQVIPKNGRRKLGIDVARYGDDKTIFCRIHGNNLLEFKMFDHQDIHQTSTAAQQYMKQHLIEAAYTAVDTVGLGAGVYDNLHHEGLKCQEFVAGAKPIEDTQQKESAYQFKNLRSQMWWMVREALQNKEICLANLSDYPLLQEDLTAPKYAIDRERIISVESKDEIKKRLGRSTDYGDAFVQAWCVERLGQTKGFWVL